MDYFTGAARSHLQPHERACGLREASNAVYHLRLYTDTIKRQTYRRVNFIRLGGGF